MKKLKKRENYTIEEIRDYANSLGFDCLETQKTVYVLSETDKLTFNQVIEYDRIFWTLN